ncbi:MAG TPA: efflux RND transporter periplasmic adaptor subunit [Anaerolineae bacterium]|nr:efflux RND transporter periplasmic adaptor subunit [Anaerolineae bacterium]
MLLLVGCQSAAVAQGQITPLRASGVIQAQEATIASEFGGRIASLPVAEANSVIAGQIVVQFDTALVDAQIAVAQGYVDTAEAGLAQANAGVRPGQIAVAEAQLAQAQAGLLVAQRAVSDTQALVANPQDINLQIAVTRAQLASAEHQLAQAVAFKDAIETIKKPVDEAYANFDGGGRYKFSVGQGTVEDLSDLLPGDFPDLPDIPIEIPDGHYSYGDWELDVSGGVYGLSRWVNVNFPLDAALLPNTWWQSWVGVNAADAKLQGLKAKLSHLYAQRANPQAMQTKAAEARALEAQLAAQVALAQTQLNAYRAGATPEQIAAVEARVAQAHAGLSSLQQQRAMLSLTSPITGVVVDLMVSPGEVAAAGAALLTVADLSDMTLKVYIPQTYLGQVWVDQEVQIAVNSFPGQVFAGRVIRIADSAEFTPRNVATQDERQNLVFAVELRVFNEAGQLKPGMTADVTFVEGK